jgi:hypothetical protein
VEEAWRGDEATFTEAVQRFWLAVAGFFARFDVESRMLGLLRFFATKLAFVQSEGVEVWWNTLTVQFLPKCKADDTVVVIAGETCPVFGRCASGTGALLVYQVWHEGSKCMRFLD